MAYQQDEMQLKRDLKQVVSSFPDQDFDVAEQVLQTLRISYDDASYQGYKCIIEIISSGGEKGIIDDIQAEGYNDLFQHFQKKLHKHCIDLRFPVGHGIRLSDEGVENSKKIQLIGKKRDFLESVKDLIPERNLYKKALQEYHQIQQMIGEIPNFNWALDQGAFDKHLDERLRNSSLQEEDRREIFKKIKKIYELKKLMIKFEEHIEDTIELSREIQEREDLIPPLEGISKIFQNISDAIPNSAFHEHRRYIESIKNGKQSAENLIERLVGYFIEFLHLVKREILDLSVQIASKIKVNDKKRPSA